MHDGLMRGTPCFGFLVLGLLMYHLSLFFLFVVI